MLAAAGLIAVPAQAVYNQDYTFEGTVQVAPDWARGLTLNDDGTLIAGVNHAIVSLETSGAMPSVTGSFRGTANYSPGSVQKLDDGGLAVQYYWNEGGVQRFNAQGEPGEWILPSFGRPDCCNQGDGGTGRGLERDAEGNLHAVVHCSLSTLVGAKVTPAGEKLFEYHRPADASFGTVTGGVLDGRGHLLVTGTAISGLAEFDDQGAYVGIINPSVPPGAGIAIDRHDNRHIAPRTPANTIVKIGPSGEELARFPARLRGGGVTVGLDVTPDGGTVYTLHPNAPASVGVYRASQEQLAAPEVSLVPEAASIDVRWTAPANFTGGQDVDHCEVRHRVVDGEWSAPVRVPAGTLEQRIGTGIAPETEYEVAVIGVDAFGDGLPGTARTTTLTGPDEEEPVDPVDPVDPGGEQPGTDEEQPSPLSSPAAGQGSDRPAGDSSSKRDADAKGGALPRTGAEMPLGLLGAGGLAVLIGVTAIAAARRRGL